ncbi:hypothetical protein BJY04DRAFT_51659 [Aspergillus karnatakaensis]|uniref:uncharacterized protein n=1 Tax=Aspergillus karnatakaensis TaxID=1810916 RepID=UPI003CCDBE93
MALHTACIEGRLTLFLKNELGKDLCVTDDLLSNPYPLEKCDYMGMVYEEAILCPESVYEDIKKVQDEGGGDTPILTIPDKYNDGLNYFAEERARFLQQPLRIRTSETDGLTWKEMMGP